MPWDTSTRTMPPGWDALRLRVLRRDRYSCQHREPNGAACPARASDVDHVKPGNDHSMTNLRALCREHHLAKSSAEGHAAWAARRIPARRPTEPHPADL